jgi:hypothetical protein
MQFLGCQIFIRDAKIAIGCCKSQNTYFQKYYLLLTYR